MSRQTSRLDAKKVNSELLTLTYGALVSQMLKEIDSSEDVNKQLERIGYNMGVRLVEDFLARTTSGRCLEMRETADKIQQAFRLYLNMQPTVTSWSSSGDEFSLVWDQCPLSEWVEMPSNGLKYCAIIPGAIRGALQMVQLDVQCWFVQPPLLWVCRARTNLLHNAPIMRALRALNAVSNDIDLFNCSLNEFALAAYCKISYSGTY
ncbi:trafficking protein particle complex subunit 3 [Hyposmocoma kahamanoa]|uniref:trafficking protein particle complex subunit 3 n=1 Tax=Hyposmocoma kahamanoa TaxID=1477025 RepID=UPI000E6D898C|nr:trafficking protein particle complex subunit 3 [Hyposmocoma kahamanoa]